MIERFQGDRGFPVLIEALLQQQLVGHDRELAVAIAKSAHLEEYQAGAELIQQGGADNDLHLILSGTTGVVVNGRTVAERGAGKHVGEMSIIDPTARRCASVVATEDTVAARVTESDFANIANSNPKIWRILAVEVCDRLRQRNEYVLEPNLRPVVFIGSSRESLHLAELVAEGLHGDIETALWANDIFQPSNFPIEDLQREVRRSDFALLVLGPDDVVISRGVANPAPRDNVILELGMFLGALTRERTFIVQPQFHELKTPSDLAGMTPLEYQAGQGVLTADAMTPVCEKLSRLIQERGVK